MRIARSSSTSRIVSVPPGRPSSASETILLVEDDRAMRMAAQQLLSKVGYREELLSGHAHRSIVLYQQNRLRPAGQAFLGFGLELRHPSIADGGEVHLRRSSLPDLAVDVELEAEAEEGLPGGTET